MSDLLLHFTSAAYLLGATGNVQTMTEQIELIKLYSTRILALAAQMPHVGSLDNPDASAMKRSPLCGSKVAVDVIMQNGKITEFAQNVKACALGQAAASVAAQNIIGRTAEEVARARDELAAMLKSGGPPPGPPFDGFEVLAPASEYKNRHASILLSLDATAEACASIAAQNSA
jgi:NifU-like protein involved in Fe-S cluster formation